MASFQKINPVEEIIRECIKTQNPILDLGNCGLHDESYELNLLADCGHITHLNLGAGYFKDRIYQKSKNNERKNSLTIIPEIISNLRSLEGLYFSENSIARILNLGNLTKLKYLQLQNNTIKKIEGLYGQLNLVELNLGNNHIEFIEDLQTLLNLEELLLYNNNINKITGLDKLIALNNLNLSANKINKINGIEMLGGLKELYLYQNKISKIENLNNLQNLQNLSLSSNYISIIEGLSSLKNLKDLQLADNQITSIDNLEIPFLEQLDKINLSNNPIEGISIRDWTNKEVILGYLKARKEDNIKIENEETSFIPNKHIKLNIIGDGRIGKTQLLNVLCGKDFEENAPETHGMNHDAYHTENNEATAIIWDFGGQSYHHGTHALFLREKDFYLALWRNVPESANYSYWLGTTRHFTGYKFYEENEKIVPLMLVQNVWQSVGDEIALPDSNKIKDYAVSFSNIHYINVKSRNSNKFWNRAWNNFRAYLDEQIITYAQSYGDIPKDFNDVREKVIQDSFKGINISKSKFKEYYAPNIADDQYEYLLDYLEYAGCILYFSKIEGLKEYIFPNPVYLSEWIYNKVLKNEDNKKIRGFTKNDLMHKGLKIQEVESFMLLADYFKLIFKSPFPKNGEDYYIVPQHLPDNNSVFKDVLFKLLPFTFCLYYPDFMHEGRIFEFHAQYGKYAKNETAYWKYGILFTHESTGLETLVYFDKNSKAVKVHIQEGKNISVVAKEIFEFFAYNITNITNDVFEFTQNKIEISQEVQLELENLIKAKKKILPYTQISTDGTHFLDISEVQKNLQNNTPFAMCKRNHKQVKLDFMTINLLSENSGNNVRVFFSYSHKDEQYKDELDRHFTMLKRSGLIETWHDRKILAGTEWDEEIKMQLEEADIVLLMLSADFFASEYIWNEELKIIRERLSNNENLKVIPIPVRSCHFEGFEFMKFQTGIRDEKGIIPWIAAPGTDKDLIYTKIVAEVEKSINGK